MPTSTLWRQTDESGPLPGQNLARPAAEEIEPLLSGDEDEDEQEYTPTHFPSPFAPVVGGFVASFDTSWDFGRARVASATQEENRAVDERLSEEKKAAEEATKAQRAARREAEVEERDARKKALHKKRNAKASAIARAPKIGAKRAAAELEDPEVRVAAKRAAGEEAAKVQFAAIAALRSAGKTFGYYPRSRS